MKKVFMSSIVAISFLCITLNANATLIGVSGPNSNFDIPAAIIPAPTHALDDMMTNRGMQGFNEALGVTTSVDYTVDSGGVIAAGSVVDSHMIFLNSDGSSLLTHENVIWEFAGLILGVMSDSGGTLEAASTWELGAPGTNYTTTFPGSGPAAPFPARGLELGGTYADSYTVSGNFLTVNMFVTEPGDWIRVVTASTPVPEPGTILLFGIGLLGLSGINRKK